MKGFMGVKGGNEKLMKFAGILKSDRKKLEQLKGLEGIGRILIV